MSSITQYENLKFRKRLDKALEATKLALEQGKCVKPQDAAHQFEDKFAVAECVTRLAYESALQFCELLGLDAAAARRLSEAKGPGKLSLALDIEAAATYLREREKAVEGPSVTVEHETSTSGGLFGSRAAASSL